MYGLKYNKTETLCGMVNYTKLFKYTEYIIKCCVDVFVCVCEYKINIIITNHIRYYVQLIKRIISLHFDMLFIISTNRYEVKKKLLS